MGGIWKCEYSNVWRQVKGFREDGQNRTKIVLRNGSEEVEEKDGQEYMFYG